MAVALAIARAVFKAYGLNGLRESESIKAELTDALERRMPGMTMDSYELPTRAALTKIQKHYGGSEHSKHYWQVRHDVVDEMVRNGEVRL